MQVGNEITTKVLHLGSKMLKERTTINSCNLKANFLKTAAKKYCILDANVKNYTFVFTFRNNHKRENKNTYEILFYVLMLN